MASEDLPSNKQPEWLETWKKTLPLLETYEKELRLSSKAPSREIHTLRVNQLDAELLDNEIHDILFLELQKVFSFWPKHILQKFQPELKLGLRLIIYRLSFLALSATYGNQLQNLRYADSSSVVHGSDAAPLSRKQKILWGICSILLPWIWERINLTATSHSWSDRPSYDALHVAWRLLGKIDMMIAVLSFLNFLVFLRDGKYSTLVTRILGIRLVYNNIGVERQVSFEYMNRQLVWQGLTEFLLYLLPLIDIERTRQWFKRIFFIGARGGDGKTTYNGLPRNCGVCEAYPIHTPFATNCGHLFCYYCIKVRCMEEEPCYCPVCGEVVTSIEQKIESI